MLYTNINGKILPAAEAATPADNGAFRYGYGLFETMLVRDGSIALSEYHWERLLSGAQQLYFEMPALLSAARLEDEVLKLARKNKMDELCRVRLQLYAAGGGLYGAAVQRPSYIIECFPLDEAVTGLNENGLVAGIADGLHKSADALSNLKSCNALIYAIAARQAKQLQWNDALITNTAGHIIESTIANIFWVNEGAIYTPPLADGCVAGVMRRHILATIPGITERILTKEILLTADEVFLTNAIKKVKWIGSIEDKKYGNNVVKSVMAALG